MHARRYIAALCATIFFDLARKADHPGGDVSVDCAPTLAEVHGLIGAGALSPRSADGAWLISSRTPT